MSSQRGGGGGIKSEGTRTAMFAINVLKIQLQKYCKK